MSYYLLIKNMKVRGANALACHYAISPAPIMASNLFAHALGRALDMPHLAVAYLHHDGRYHAESDPVADFKKTVFQQRRAATYINKDDYAQGTTSLSLQPVANISLKVSIVIEFAQLPDADVARRFITQGRFAGGVIESFRDIVVFDEYDEQGFLAIPGNGYWLVDRSDCLEGDDPAQSLVEQLAKKPSSGSDENNSWLTPIVAGYSLISTPVDQLPGVRSLSDGSHPAHAFGEPLLGLAQFVSVRAREAGLIPFWKASWVNETTYLLQQRDF